AELASAPTGGASFRALFDVFRRLAALERADYQSEVTPYVKAISAAAVQLNGGAPLADAVRPFLELPLADRCYLLDGNGRQVGVSVVADHAPTAGDPRYAPLSNAEGANW